MKNKTLKQTLSTLAVIATLVGQSAFARVPRITVSQDTASELAVDIFENIENTLEVESDKIRIEVKVPRGTGQGVKLGFMDSEGEVARTSLGQCLSQTIHSRRIRQNANSEIVTFLIEYEVNNDDGDNFCGIQLDTRAWSKKLAFGFKGLD